MIQAKTTKKLKLPAISVITIGVAAIVATGAVVATSAGNDTPAAPQLTTANIDLGFGPGHHLVGNYNLGGNGWFHGSFDDATLKVTMNGHPVVPNSDGSPAEPVEPSEPNGKSQVSVSIDHHQTSTTSDDSSTSGSSGSANAKNTTHSTSSTTVRTHTHTNDNNSGYSSSTITKNGKVQSTTEHNY